MPRMVPQWLIEKKRDGQALADEEIRFLVDGYTDGRIPDYQMAALAMAIYFRGMTPAETACLTDAMMRSGELVDTGAIRRFKADKHSTGGVGDKVSLVLAPLVASCGVAVPMISGRGLGITGGTLDKLESIPGYRTDLSAAEFVRIVDECGCSITGQTAALAPADRKLYALRDVTGTVPSIPLIAASILSKKLAEGADGLVLDVKCGSGAFMKTPEDARRLARTMLGIGTRLGRRMAAVLTDMDQPLGRAAGNAVEVAEAIRALRGEGPADLMRVTLHLGAHMLRLAGAAPDLASGRAALRERIASGEALETFARMVTAQGGERAAVDDPGRLPAAGLRHACAAAAAGTVARVDANRIGRACLALGAGRTRVDESVDPAVGVTDLVKIGEAVENGQPLLVVHANDDDRLEQAMRELDGAVTVSAGEVAAPNLILDDLLDATGDA